MIAKSIDDYNQHLPSDRLLNHLTQTVLSYTDEEIERENSTLKDKKGKLVELKNDLESVRKKLVVAASEYKRLKLLNTVLTRIDALKKEGVLVGDNKNKISKLLSNIDNKSVRYLRSLEDKLSAYVPEVPDKVIY